MKKLKLFFTGCSPRAIASAGFTACSDVMTTRLPPSDRGLLIRQDTYGIDIITFTAEGTWIEQYQDPEGFRIQRYRQRNLPYDGSVLDSGVQRRRQRCHPRRRLSGDTLVLDGEVYTRM